MLSFIRRFFVSLISYIISRVIILGLIFAFITVCVVGAWDFHKFLKAPIAINQNEYTLEIKPGTSISQLAESLQRQGMINNQHYFAWYGRITGQARKIQAGEYIIKRGMDLQDVLTLITSGRVIQYSFTIIDGWTFNELRKNLSNNKNIVQTLKGLTHEEVMEKLELSEIPFEGRFLPDTYFFPKGYTDQALLKRSYSAMQTVAKEAWKNRDLSLPIKSINELLVLASLIEKETGVASERPMISGVFIRRLQKNMRLQTDPTVIYGLGDSYRGTLYRSDLQKDTPFNTYTRNGLPPTPIAMPSKASIYAAVNPAIGNALYFVAKGDGSGQHVFSATYEEHQKAVQAYRKRMQ